MKRLLPLFVAAGRPVDATERLARRDISRYPVFSRRLCALADPAGCSDRQRVIPVKGTPRLLREGVVNVRAMRRKRKRPPAIELLLRADHIETRDFPRRKIMWINKNRRFRLHTPHRVGDLSHESELIVEKSFT